MAQRQPVLICSADCELFCLKPERTHIGCPNELLYFSTRQKTGPVLEFKFWRNLPRLKGVYKTRNCRGIKTNLSFWVEKRRIRIETSNVSDVTADASIPAKSMNCVINCDLKTSKSAAVFPVLGVTPTPTIVEFGATMESSAEKKKHRLILVLDQLKKKDKYKSRKPKT